MPLVEPLHFVLKIASRCNLNCSYCYVYNKGDQSWSDRPHFMSRVILRQTLDRIREHCDISGQKTVRILFHGGEPCLVGPDSFEEMCRTICDTLGSPLKVKLTLQTNGTLLNEEWMGVFRSYGVDVAISLDGPPAMNDMLRITHDGRGSYTNVLNGIKALKAADMPVSILSVVHLGADPILTHRHFLELGAAFISYLLPDYTHNTVQDVRKTFGPTPCADYLIPILNDWWRNGHMGTTVEPFTSISRAILGGRSAVDFIGNQPLRFLFIETDGAIQILDVLRVCRPGLIETGFNVNTSSFTALLHQGEFAADVVFSGLPLPTDCHSCVESSTCAGGYLPHRYSHERGFNNASVWCLDLLAVFRHMRLLLGVEPEETLLRRIALADCLAGDVPR